MKQRRLWTPIYEDADSIAVNKASGIAVTGDRWTPSIERLDKLLAAEKGFPRLFVVHRIDKGTSGIVLFAKNEAAHKKFSSAFARHTVKKTYDVVVRGRPLWNETTCVLPLLPCANKKHLTIVELYRGKKSKTVFTVQCAGDNYSVLEATPETGRQHQIRVHLARLGHPVVCDELYGDGKAVYLSSVKRHWRGDRQQEQPLLDRLGLHAAALAIPEYGLDLCAPLPKDMNALITQLAKLADTRLD